MCCCRATLKKRFADFQAFRRRSTCSTYYKCSSGYIFSQLNAYLAYHDPPLSACPILPPMELGSLRPHEPAHNNSFISSWACDRHNRQQHGQRVDTCTNPADIAVWARLHGSNRVSPALCMLICKGAAAKDWMHSLSRHVPPNSRPAMPSHQTRNLQRGRQEQGHSAH